MKEIVYNCHVCESDEISNGEDMDFSLIKDKGTGDWDEGSLSGLYYYKAKKGLFSSKENNIYLCEDCAGLICDYLGVLGYNLTYDQIVSNNLPINREYGWYEKVELNQTYAYCDEDGNETGDNFNLEKRYIAGRRSKKILNLLLNDIENFRNELKSISESQDKEVERMMQEDLEALQEDKKEFKRLGKLELKIIELLKEKNKKITVSDIDAFLKHSNLDEIKRLCEKLYAEGKISFAGNGRYFILTEEKEKPKKASAAKSEEVDVKSELKKYKEMLDDGLITQEQYDAKSNELLGL